MIPVSRFIRGGRGSGNTLSGGLDPTNCSIGQALANRTEQDAISAVGIANAQADAVVIAEVEFSHVAAQVGLRAMLVDALHPALEDRIEAFHGVGVDVAVANVFACGVAGEIVSREVLVDSAILASIVGHDVRGVVHVGFDDRHQGCGRSAGYVEADDARPFGAALDQGQDGVLVTSAALDWHAFLAADEGFVDFDNPAFSAKRRHDAAFHRFTDAVREEPSGLQCASEHPIKLVAGNALFAGAKQVNGLQPKVQFKVAILENGAVTNREILPAGVALAQANPRRLTLKRANPLRAFAVGANRPLRPKAGFHIGEGSLFIVKTRSGKNRSSHGKPPVRRKLPREPRSVKYNIAPFFI
jgi:hypothetical protein